ncbi:uncharacterized protein PHACADRAFT_256097 [Phanerochaete carnosa HHB-10118-sp]|uniref:Knr4/Smi1-like domain-containing protein n=1 Tax=Phanerochaete carnosa (strain HHB-10118-sp) TaxID=650164 RepID=K5W914_PHACS|nr:uncharacterized protein PHACADRAFT_256097 [Phanerochaete carnosa HHB-10118-sp]EKM55459.1 hypothetical protein PHACADRAFT_256097 [Phanerochaete carnosa HHB-10118-sp]
MTAPYPPLQLTWNRLRAWLANEYPELGDTLNYGILPQDLQQIEVSFGFALPQAIRDSYLCADGQEAESAAGCSEGLFFGLTLLPLEDILEEWRFWREVDDDPNTGANSRLRGLMDSIPPGWIRREYSSRGWIPLVADKAGNYLGVDLNPSEGGSIGQVIVFGRDFDTKVVMWRGDGPHGWAKWLAGFVDDLESGEGYELGANNDSEGSEDSVGYEDYFYDGTGRGSGDGGGNAGTGGMRLAGEYKGWNVLEAWADRSVRKWQQAGVIPTPDPEQQASMPAKTKHVEHISDVKLRSLSGTNSGAEVPIPVLADSSQPSTSAHTLDDEASGSQSLPIISVTKPPAPRPVSLPTQDDIDVSPSRNDIEAGSGALDMQEVGVALPAVSVITKQPSSPRTDSPRAVTPIPPPPASLSHTPSRTMTQSPELIQSPTTAIPETTDLLADVPLSNFDEVPPVVVTEGLVGGDAEDSPVLVNSEDAHHETSSNDGVLVSDAETDTPEIVESHAAEPEAA